MISTNLIVSVNEDAVGGDPSAVTLKTTITGNIIVEMACPKVAIKLEDLEEATQTLKHFISSRIETGPLVDTTVENQPTFNFEYNDEEESKENFI